MEDGRDDGCIILYSSYNGGQKSVSSLHELWPRSKKASHVYIVAATSRPDKIDKALLRPGRLEILDGNDGGPHVPLILRKCHI